MRQTRSFRFSCVTIAVSAVFVGCAGEKRVLSQQALIAAPVTIEALERDPAMAEMLLVQRADAAAALASALRRGDTRLLGIAGFALEVPGPDEADRLAHEKYGVREIHGGGDHGISDDHQRLIEGARAYAARYNTLLLQHLHEIPKR